MMKRLTIVFFLLIFVLSDAFAQVPARGIRFSETTVWKKVLRKAKKENKLIFIDSYASWCFPCKKLAYKIFVQDSVGEYFNRNFINVKYDMEQDPDGKILKKKYGVKVYPTLLFIDPKTEEVHHRICGAGDAGWLLANARLAGNPECNLKGLTARYRSGVKDVGFLKQYLDALFNANEKDLAKTVTGQYLEQLPLDKFVTEEGWKLFNECITDATSPVFKRFVDNQDAFRSIAGDNMVDKKIGFVLGISAFDLVNASMRTMVLDKTKFQTLRKRLLEVDSPSAPGALAYLYTLEYILAKDYKGMLSYMEEIMKYNLFRKGDFTHYIQIFMRNFCKCEDKVVLQSGLDFIDRLLAKTGDNVMKTGLYSSKVELQMKIGDKEGAAKSMAERQKYFRLSQENNR